MFRPILLSALFASAAFAPCLAQYEAPDPSGFQGLTVETYYVSDADDADDTDGGTGLHAGAVTYRVFVDLKPGYKLLTVGGFPNHPLTMSSSTGFFNNDDRGEAWGGDIDHNHLDDNTVAIDSWLSMGAGSDAHWGVLKTDDNDGSIVGGVNNDGGSNGVPSGLLVNNVPAMGLPLTTADGLFTADVPPSVTSVGDAPSLFDSGGDNSYSSDNFAWAVLGGIAGPDTTNRILIGQFTSDGVVDLCFNLWVRIPDSLVCSDPNCHQILEFYSTLLESDTAGGGFGTDNKFTHPTLCFHANAPTVDCLGVPNGPAQPGTPCDDGNPDTQNDVYDAGCTCLGEDCLGVLGGGALPGTPCDDGDPNTQNDVWQTGCACSGSVGIDEQVKPALVTVVPNPTRDRVQVNIHATSGARTTITLRDALGQVVQVLDLGTVNGSISRSIDMSTLGTGLYFVDVVSGTQHALQRIVKY